MLNFDVENKMGITIVLSKARNTYMNDFKTWSDQEDLGMAAMALGDLASCMGVLDALLRGNTELAEHQLMRIDTAPREYLWDMLEREQVIIKD